MTPNDTDEPNNADDTDDAGAAEQSGESAAAVHVPVMLAEVLEYLDPQPGQTIVDGTYGGGGHARALAERVGPDGLVIGLDRDGGAIERAAPHPHIRTFHAGYLRTADALTAAGRTAADGILLDLGLSSDQLADASRGFSFTADGPLDLRFDTEEGRPAADLVNYLPEKQLADVIYEYGEERHSRRIARRIVEVRRRELIRTAQELADIVKRATPRGRPGKGPRIHPATRTFQALRIAVNEELKGVEQALAAAPDWLADGGRIAVISFHSLEDRLAKNAFRQDLRYQSLTKKPIRATEAEARRNPRSRSAKLRVAARVPRHEEQSSP